MLATLSPSDVIAVTLPASTFLALFLVLAVSALPALLAGFLAANARMMVRYDAPVVGVYRRARDGRSFVQIGRTCHFGCKGESEQSLRARLAARGVL